MDLYEQKDLRIAFQHDDIRVLEELVREAEEHLQQASSATMYVRLPYAMSLQLP